MFLHTILLTIITVSSAAVLKSPDAAEINASSLPVEHTAAHWLRQGADFVQQQRQKRANVQRARNVILFLGDGMSVATTTATRVYLGGEETSLPFDHFPHVGMARTYCVDYQVPDSACTSTAYLSGVKANYGTLGVRAAVKRKNCKRGQRPKYWTESIAAWAQRSGALTGLVTTTRVTHASPAGLYAHIADRDWENDDQVQQGKCGGGKTTDVLDIAQQLVLGDVGGRLRVVLGGGRQEFRDRTRLDEEGEPGLRADGRDLVAEWLERRADEAERKRFVWNKADLLAINATVTDYLLGLFEPSHCLFNLDIAARNLSASEPTLAEMVERAIDVLEAQTRQTGASGYFLFVEGGRIDHAHHETRAKYALEETAEFGRAIEATRRRLSDSDSLLVVTADHAHTMSYAGYNPRGGDVLGTAGMAGDGMEYMALSYANGPGFEANMNQTSFRRVDPLTLDTTASEYTWPALLPLAKETHGGEDVAVYAVGPWSHLFGGPAYEQSVLPHLMAYAACWGDGRTMCGADGDGVAEWDGVVEVDDEEDDDEDEE